MTLRPGSRGWLAAAALGLGLGAGSGAQGESADGSADGSAGGSQVDNPFRGVMQDRSADGPREALYVEKCGMCHRQMGMGTVLLARRMPRERAWLEAREDLNAPLIEAAVRRGIGNMPRIPRAEVSDGQLAAITKYLTMSTP